MIIDEPTMLKLITSADKPFLLEPPYNRKYLPLGLSKIASLIYKHDKFFEYGRYLTTTDTDLVIMTTLFTWDWDHIIRAVQHVREFAPGTPILMGGVCATLNAKKLNEMFGDRFFIYKGYSKVLDMCRPLYDYPWDMKFSWDNWSFVFTTRGCPNKCSYCSVWRTEPGTWINPRWSAAVDYTKPFIMVSDNNLSAYPRKHYRDVVSYINDHDLQATFDNGFDCKLMDDEFCRLAASVKYVNQGFRTAFDRIEEDGIFQDAMTKALRAGVPADQFMVYVLFNYGERIQEANYRMRECVKLGIRPYPQRFVPYNKKTRRPKHVGKYWGNEKLVQSFHYFWLHPALYKTMTFKEYLQEGGAWKTGSMELEIYNKTN